jgi:acyl-coenzyme A synthetase/AMP-(fatty) acid ligase
MSDELSLLLMTSGSTGGSKLVRHKYGNLEYSARAVAESFDWTSSERSICNLPMNYTMGLSVINSTLYIGGTVLLCNDMMSPDFWSFVTKNKGTSFTGVPYSYTILNKLRFTQMNLPHLIAIYQGGGKLTEKDFIKLAEYAKSTNRRFIATYGTTETSARVTVLDPEKSLEKLLSIGIPIEGCVIYLINEDGEKILDNEIEGELVVEGPNVTMGYADCRGDLLNGDDFNGLYITGDLAKRDSDGYYYIVGRKKRFLKLYGLRINLDECEKLISNKFSIECACTGNDSSMRVYITNTELKNQVNDFIIRKTSLSIHAFKVLCIKEIPKNDNGKTTYSKLHQ